MRTGSTVASLLRYGPAAVLFLSVATAYAHQPHDNATVVALSPSFRQDGIAFAVARRAQIPHPKRLLRSVDGGLSWQRIINGLNHRGQIMSVCVSPGFATDRTVVAATDSDGIYVSKDGGLSWQNISDGLPSLAIGGIACSVDGDSKLVLLAVSMDDEVVRTEDLGATWTVIDDSIPITAIGFSPDFAQDGLVVAGDDQGNLYFSRNHGRDWAFAATLEGAGTIHEIALTSRAAAAFIGTQDGLYRTFDRGKTFTRLNQCLPAGPVTALGVSPSFEQDQTLFAAVGDQGVFKSTDRGDCWTQHQDGIELDELQANFHFQMLQVSPDFANDQTVFLAMFEGVFRSTDGGEHWLQLEIIPQGTILDVEVSPAFSSDSTITLCRYGGGAGISFDSGSTWAVANQGIETPFLFDMDFSSNYVVDQTLFTIHWNRRLLKSNNSGATWTRGELVDGFSPTAIGVSPNYAVDQTIFVGSRHEGIFRSVDGGVSWQRVFWDSDRRVDSFAISPDFQSNPTIFAGGPVVGVLRSTDGGSTWYPANTNLTLDGHRGPRLRISPNYLSDQTLFAATLQGLYKSTDSGDTWSPVTVGSNPQDAPIEEVAISPAFASDGILLASVRGVGLFRTTDAGTTWSEIAPELVNGNHLLQGIRFSPAFSTDGTVFGFEDSQLFRSVDAGDSWQPLSQGPVRHENDLPVHQWNFYEGWWRKIKWERASARSIYWGRGSESLARFYFNGTGVRWIGVRSKFFGIAEVYLDGIFQAEVDQYGSLEPLVTMFSLTDLPAGFHELEIIATGRKNPNALGIGLAVDAFDVLNESLDPD